MIDLHCHILPGVDDGAQELTESLRMAELLAGLGFERVFATPHVPWGSMQVDMQAFNTNGLRLIEEMRSSGSAVELGLAAEHYSDLVPEILNVSRPACYPRGDTFLMEFPLSGFPARMDDLLFMIEVKGLRPAIAHVERYPDVQRDPRAVERLSSRGCFVLINLASLAGDWSKQAQKAAAELVEAGLVDAVTTDLHSPDRIGLTESGLRILSEIVDEQAFDNLVRRNPAHISGVDDEPGEEAV